MIYDGIFYVTSAVCVNGRLSIFSDEERFEQTVNTIKSIQKYCPNSQIYVVDVSSEEGYEKYLDKISETGANVLYIGDHPIVREYSKNGMKSQGELTALILFLEWFEQNKVEAKRIYKISGRYELNDNFKLGLEYKNSFVFLKSVDSWMPEEIQNATGIKKFFETRLYHMDYNLFPLYKKSVYDMLETCNKYNVNIEHSIYHVLKDKNVVELDKVGLSGRIAPSGEFKDD